MGFPITENGSKMRVVLREGDSVADGVPKGACRGGQCGDGLPSNPPESHEEFFLPIGSERGGVIQRG